MIDSKTLEQITLIAHYIHDHKGDNTVAIDVSESSSWADCFIIATVTSFGHLRGLSRSLWGYLAEHGIEVLNRHKQVTSDGWLLIDTGDIIIHLMSSEMREFYSLEKLWHQAPRIELELPVR
ncbi:MAG: ribosome silencing factor [Sphaerochaetaceae bacterium]|jgi:ribosome-associated protein